MHPDKLTAFSAIICAGVFYWEGNPSKGAENRTHTPTNYSLIISSNFLLIIKVI